MMSKTQNSLTIDAAIARQRHGNHISTAMNKHAIVEEFLEAVFSVRFMLRLCNEDKQSLGFRR
jgi:hypothetical protein